MRNIFSYSDIAQEISPFLLLDYAGPTEFKPTDTKRGVGEHPHRGFETVSIVYHGEVSHRDSSGGGGTIGPGEVQWMTAASGVVHEEYHGPNYSRTGGRFQMVQLWVNLPAHLKMSPPRYQSITRERIPEASLSNNAGSVRVIAGNCLGSHGPAQTFTPMNVWDVRLKAGGKAVFELPEGHTATFLVLEGIAQVTDESGALQEIHEAQVAVLDTVGTTLEIKAASHSDKNCMLLVMSGEPLHEPVVGYGPFVMNTEQEIRQAYQYYRSGKMGKLT